MTLERFLPLNPLTHRFTNLRFTVGNQVNTSILTREKLEPCGQVRQLAHLSPLSRKLPAGISIPTLYCSFHPENLSKRRPQEIPQIKKRRTAESKFPIDDRRYFPAGLSLFHENVRAIEIAVTQTWLTSPFIEQAGFISYKIQYLL